MIITTNVATPLAARFRLPALLEVRGTGASIEGRCMTAGAAHVDGVYVPAFLKDTFSGVRAWSPPV